MRRKRRKQRKQNNSEGKMKKVKRGEEKKEKITKGTVALLEGCRTRYCFWKSTDPYCLSSYFFTPHSQRPAC